MRKRILAALGLIVPSILAAAGVAGIAEADTATAHRALSAHSAPADSTVRLITGDVLRLGTDAHGRPTVRAVSPDRRGIAGQLEVTRSGNKLYAIPGAAQRYLGRVIDPGVFEISDLARAEKHGRTPVRLSFAAGATHSAPGVTVTGGSGNDATGYLTAASARAFGRALVAQWKSDARPGAHPSGRLFGGLTRIGLDTPASPVAHPNYPQVTLIIKVTDQNGKPLSEGEVDVMNTDDAARFTGFLPVVDGEARASLPLGNYSDLSSIDNYDETTNTDASYLLSVGDYKITRDMQTLTVSARDARKLSIETPRPAGTVAQTADWTRADRVGGGMDTVFALGSGSTVYVTPTPKVTVGQLYWTTAWTLRGAPERGLPYSYDATYSETGRIAASQRHIVTRAQETVLDSRYYTDGADRNSMFARTPVYPFQFGSFTSYDAQPAPLHRTEYVIGPKDVLWQASLLANSTEEDPFGAEVDDGYRSYVPGSIDRVDWLRGALAPGVLADTPGNPFWACAVCRTRGSLSVDLAPVLDSAPGHSGEVSVPESGHAARFRIYRNGKVLDDEYDVTGGMFGIPAGKATYRVIDTVQRAQDGFTGSTTSTVDVSFAAAAGSGGKLPAGWECGAEGSGACTIPAMLQADLPLRTDLTGQLPAGLAVTSFTVNHIQGAPNPAIRSARLQLSFDGGKTWHAAPTFAAGGGRFRAVLVNPESQVGHRVSVRVTATDTLGGSLTQTVLNAYAVSSR